MIKMTNRKRTIQLTCLLFLAAGLVVMIGFPLLKTRSNKTHPSDSVAESVAGSESETATSAELSEVVFLNDLLHVHEIGAAAANDPAHPDDDVDHCVRIAYLYQGRQPEMTFVSSDNPKANEMCKELRQEELRCEPYRGYQYARMELWFDFSLLQPGESVVVNSITVSVDGRETTLDTKGNLILSRVTEAEERDREDYELSHVIEHYDIDNSLLPKVTDDTIPISVKLSGLASRDIVLEQITFTDWFQIAYSTIGIGNKPGYTGKNGTPEEILPLSVSNGNSLSISLIVHPKVEWHPFSEFRTELQMRYLDENGIERVLPLLFEGSAMSNEEWVHSIIDNVTDGLPGDAEKIVFLEDTADFKYWGSVDVLFLYRDEEETPYLRLKEIESEEVKAALTGYSFEMGKQGAYLGYRLGVARFYFDPFRLEPGKRVPVGKIRLLVGETEAALDLTEQVVLVGLSREWDFPAMDEPVLQGSGSIQIRDDSRCVCTIEGLASRQVTLQKWDMGDVLQFGTEQVKVCLNEKEISSSKLFPLTLHTGDRITIETDYKYENRLRDYCLISCTDAAGTEGIYLITVAKTETPYTVDMAREAFMRLLNDLKERGKI